jgi:nucleoside-diphosphate-sugar epimerase
MILITGASGFIGKNLVPELSRHRRIRILVRKTSNLTWLKRSKNIQIVYGDIEKNEGLPHALEGVDTVVHSAARTIGKNFWEYYATNTLGTQHLVRAMERAGSRRIVLLSTHAVCGPTRTKQVVDEHVSPRPVSHYGRSKLLAEHIVRNSGFEHIILRPVAVYGPHDVDVLKYIRIINTGICPVVGMGEKHVNLIHINDLMRLIIDIVHIPAFTKKTYFVHDGHSYSYRTVLNTIAEILDKKIVIVPVPVTIALMTGLLSDVFMHGSTRTVWRDKVRELAGTSWLCCQDEVRKDFSFVPRYDLSRGMKNTIDWYRSNHLL